MDNIANLTSPHRTSVQLAQNKVATNHVTAANYIEHLTRAFLFHPVKRQIDFIALRGSEKMYIQVSSDVSSRETLLREIEPLAKVKDAYPKMLIARTRNPETDYEGIRIVNIVEWLLK